MATPSLAASTAAAGRRCSLDGCARPHHARGLCNTHYVRLRRTGSPLARPRHRPLCRAPGCPHPAKARGLCNTHYARLRRGGRRPATGAGAPARGGSTGG